MAFATGPGGEGSRGKHDLMPNKSKSIVIVAAHRATKKAANQDVHKIRKEYNHWPHIHLIQPTSQ